mmetsp:Transcript_126305/g.252355  ORF Transcript_126305/g.252355 Transcript_126305/m.252355 type:complete len:310 (-) Transcript_126305:77-1006(-)
MDGFGDEDEHVLQKLKARNRQLHEQLQHLVSKNESAYKDKVSDVKEACMKRLEEQEKIHSEASTKKVAEVQLLRAGSMIAWSLFSSRKGMLSTQLKADQATYAIYFENYRKEKAQLETSQFGELQEAYQKAETVTADCEKKLAAHKADADSSIHSLESELEDAREEGRRLSILFDERQRELEVLTRQRQQQQLEIEQLEARVAAPRASIKKIKRAAQKQRDALEREIGDYTYFLDTNLQKQQDFWEAGWPPKAWPLPPSGSPKPPMRLPPSTDGAAGMLGVITTMAAKQGPRQESLPLLLQPRRLPPLS